MTLSTEDLQLEEKDFQAVKRKKVAKPLLWFGMVSIIMLFAGLTSAVIVRKADGNWDSFQIPDVFLYSTIVLFVSSISMYLSLFFAKKNNYQGVLFSLLTTLILGISFISLQVEGYERLVEMGVFFTGEKQTASGSFLYIISALHIAHLLGGMVGLLITLFNAYRRKYKSKNLLGLQLCSIYWHFMDAMWIYLYIFFAIVI